MEEWNNAADLLLKSAHKGSKRAQYALGTLRLEQWKWDSKHNSRATGLYWLGRSANQKYQKAVDKLTIS